MYQPPNDPYFKQRQQRNQTPVSPQQSVRSSSRKPGNYPNPSHQRSSSQQATPNLQRIPNYPGQASRFFSPPKGSESTRGQKPDYAPSAWIDSAEFPVKPKKLHRRLVDLITIAVVLALIVGGVATFLHTTLSQQTATVVNIVVPTPILATPSAGVVGRPTQVSGWIVTITHIKSVTSHVLSASHNVDVEVNLALKNTSTAPQIVVSLLEFLLVDANGMKFHEALADPDIKQPADGNIAADQTLQAQIAFEVPKATRNFVLDFQYGLIENSTAAVGWPITM